MQKIKNIKVGEYYVHSSGTIIGVVNQPIVFTIDNLIFEFRFINDPITPENKVTPELSDDKTKLILNFKNFNNPLGTGSTKPIKIGTLNSRDLLLNYRVYALSDDSGKMLHYTWLQS